MSARLVTLAVPIAIVLAGEAAAQSPPTFGGGRLQTAALPRGYEPTVGISLQPRGGQIAVRFDTSLRCGRESFEVTGRKLVPFNGSSFSLDGASAKNVARGRLVWTWTLQGQVSGPVANGTLQIGGARRISGRSRACRAKPTRQFEARVAAPTAGAAQPRSRGLYAGTSTYEVVDRLQAPVVMRVSEDARKVTSRWTIGARCRRGPRELIVNITPPTTVRADGTFSRSERYSVRYLDALIRYRAQFGGRFAGDGASGTLRLRARVYNRSGQRLRTRCDSGRRPWSTVLAAEPGPAPTAGPAPGGSTPGAWSLSMTSDPGDFIGQGRSWHLGPPTYNTSGRGDPTLVQLWVGNEHEHWNGDFEAPQGQTLTAGATYPNARRYPFNEPAPGLDVTGHHRGCNESSGTFTVDEIAFHPDGRLRRFKVRFEQHCEHAAPRAAGHVDVLRRVSLGSRRCGPSPAPS